MVALVSLCVTVVRAGETYKCRLASVRLLLIFNLILGSRGEKKKSLLHSCFPPKGLSDLCRAIVFLGMSHLLVNSCDFLSSGPSKRRE